VVLHDLTAELERTQQKNTRGKKKNPLAVKSALSRDYVYCTKQIKPLSLSWSIFVRPAPATGATAVPAAQSRMLAPCTLFVLNLFPFLSANPKADE
jgi:hypothetical protein